ncbi:MAG: hypothetical protein ACLT8Y_13070 [Dorea formicigenerans]
MEVVASIFIFLILMGILQGQLLIAVIP